MPIRNKFMVLLVAFIAVFIGRQILLGGPTVSLSEAPPLTGIISQSMYSVSGKGSLPIVGKDFNLKNTRYFEGDQWVATSISPVGQRLNAALVVLQKQDGIYRVVLGPGSAFDSSVL